MSKVYISYTVLLLILIFSFFSFAKQSIMSSQTASSSDIFPALKGGINKDNTSSPEEKKNKYAETGKDVEKRNVKTELSALKENFDNSLRKRYEKLKLAEKGLSFSIFHDAMVRYDELKIKNLIKGRNLLSIADMEKSSTEKRFFVLDLDAEKVLYNTYVSHGKGSGDEFAKVFSNTPNSNATSIGMYITGNTYYGKNGFSLRMDGFDKGYNDKARERAIVVHGADYASPSFIKKTGRLGRSQGCPALPLENYKEIINTIANGTALFIASGDQDYEKTVIKPAEDALINNLYKSLNVARTGL